LSLNMLLFRPCLSYCPILLTAAVPPLLLIHPNLCCGSIPVSSAVPYLSLHYYVSLSAADGMPAAVQFSHSWFISTFANV
jgi:hypothetical protein